MKSHTKLEYRFSRLIPNLFLMLLMLIQVILATGCGGTGNLRFNPLPSTQKYTLSGKIELPEIVETDLLTSVRGNLQAITDFTKFKVYAGEHSAQVSSDGSFTLSDIPYSDKLMLQARAGKVSLLLRVYPTDLNYTNISKLSIGVNSTVQALIWKYASDTGKELTKADITAREYDDDVGSLTTAIKLALQLSPSNAGDDILTLPMVVNPALSAARKIQAREEVIRESNMVFKNIILRKDLTMFKSYISPSFSNDWDSSSNWSDITATFEKYFKDYNFLDIDWNIEQIEMLPDNMARVRIKAKAKLQGVLSEQITETSEYVFDSIWRKEGTFWKIYRNMPYKTSHPTQVGADARWGEIADIHRQLQVALANEDINVFKKYISPVFGNDWDPTSTYSDIIETAKSRFNHMDVKIATYSIDAIDFIGTDMARVHCSAEVRVISLIPGIDIDSGPIKAVVDWRREDGIWKIYRNLPYRFTHPLK